MADPIATSAARTIAAKLDPITKNTHD